MHRPQPAGAVIRGEHGREVGGARELAPPARIQFTRQGELDLAVEPPVGALMRVRRLPAGARFVLRQRGHVAVLHMLAFLAVSVAAALPPVRRRPGQGER